ncbi:hypothetical protein [Terriglobus sp. TAA 43]|uniref:hypothetical protein n=1 Tax=Terriglobus sp. TAA 43 TaxID=278961 RepID=UPI00064688C1|nr:hypothetical protein [Terriglobus sp. TAA 43]
MPQDHAFVEVDTLASLPDSPGFSSSQVQEPSFVSVDDIAEWQASTAAPTVARKYAHTIKPGYTAVPWGAKEKITASVLKMGTVGAVFSAAFTGGRQQLLDARPHYGTDSGAYGERVGADFARQSTQAIMNGGMSAILRDDPRYYVLGSGHPFKSRVIYAAERVLITHKDSGGDTVNIPLFTGIVASQALANGIYPDQDREWTRVATGSLGSIASRMATQQFKEFGDDIRQYLRHKFKKD